MAVHPGLNRVTLGEFPALPDGLAGTQAHEWLATWGIAARMAQRFPALGLPPAPASVNPVSSQGYAAFPLALDGLVHRGDPQALAFADDLGRALGALIATLHHAPAGARAARPEWPDSHWARWQAVRQIVLGGGILSGALGQRLVTTARMWLPRLDAQAITLHLSAQARLLALRGLARQLPDGPAVVVDAGHTAIKRAAAEVRGGEVVALTSATLLRAPGGGLGPDTLLDALTAALQGGCPEGVPVSQFGLSLSLHMDAAGQPIPGAASGSAYGALADTALPADLSRRLSGALGRPASVLVQHEGRAAVHGLPGMDAAILLGTSVGGAVSG